MFTMISKAPLIITRKLKTGGLEANHKRAQTMYQMSF